MNIHTSVIINIFKPRNMIYHYILIPSHILNLCIKLLELKNLSNQIRLSILFSKRISNSHMVCINYYLRTNDIGLKLITSKYYHKHLLFHVRVNQFSLIKCLASIIDGLKDLILYLTKNCPNDLITSIAHDLNGLFLIKLYNNQSRSQLFPNNIKCLKTSFIKLKRSILLKQATEKLHNLGKVFNEPSIESYIAMKTPDVSTFVGGGGFLIVAILVRSISKPFEEI